MVCSLQLVVTTYSCGHHEVHTDNEKGKSNPEVSERDQRVVRSDYGEDHQHGHTRERRGQGGYAKHETASPETRQYVGEMTEPELAAGGGYGEDDPTWQVAAPDVSEYDEFYEWYQGKWHHTTEKSIYKSLLMADDTTKPSSQEARTSNVPSRSRRGDSSSTEKEVAPPLRTSQSYIPIGYRDLGSNGTSPRELTTKSGRKTFSKSLLTADNSLETERVQVRTFLCPFLTYSSYITTPYVSGTNGFISG